MGDALGGAVVVAHGSPSAVTQVQSLKQAGTQVSNWQERRCRVSSGVVVF